MQALFLARIGMPHPMPVLPAENTPEET